MPEPLPQPPADPFWPALKTAVQLVAADVLQTRWDSADQLRQHGPEALRELLRHW